MRSFAAFLAGFATAALLTVAVDRWLNAEEYRRPFPEARPC